jgi:hypothetical protein
MKDDKIINHRTGRWRVIAYGDERVATRKIIPLDGQGKDAINEMIADMADADKQALERMVKEQNSGPDSHI